MNNDPIYIGILNKIPNVIEGHTIITKSLKNYKNIINLLALIHHFELHRTFHIYLDGIDIAQAQFDQKNDIKVGDLIIPHEFFKKTTSLTPNLISLLNERCSSEIVRQMICQQIDCCNQVMNIINHYTMSHGGPHMVTINNLTDMIKLIAINTTINWTLVRIFNKIDEFITLKKLISDKHHNQLYYISTGTSVGFLIDQKKETYISSSCLGLFVNHKKKTYHIYPVLDHFKDSDPFIIYQSPTIKNPYMVSNYQCIYDWDTNDQIFTL